METELETIRQSLALFQDRQVVLNYYEDEELVERDGFLFETLEVTNDEIKFMVGENLVKRTISLDSYSSFAPSEDFFKNYFVLINGCNQLRIYFP